MPNLPDTTTPAPHFIQHGQSSQPAPAMTMQDLDARIDSRINLVTKELREATREKLTTRDKAYLAGAAVGCALVGVGLTIGVQKFRNRNQMAPGRTNVTVK